MKHTLLKGLCIACLSLPAWAGEEAPADKHRQDYESRLASTNALAEAYRREAARSGANEAAVLSLLAKNQREAEKLAERGDHQRARAALDIGYGALVQALAALENARKQGGPTAGPAQQAPAQTANAEQVSRQIQSARFLLDALVRQSREKRLDRKQEIAGVERLIGEASQSLSANRLDQAHQQAGEAYRRAKESIAGMQPASDMKTGSAALEAAERPGPIPALVERRIQSTRTLIEALREQGKSRRADRAREADAMEAMIDEAAKAFEGGDVERADRLTEETYLRAKGAIARLQQPSEMKSGSAALEADRRTRGREAEAAELAAIYKRREESVATLFAAADRISAAQGKYPETLRDAESELLKARAHAAAKRLPEAIVALDRAYLQTRRTIATHRHGQQVVADKNFATKNDEYRYEQLMNDDYLKLIEFIMKHRRVAAWNEPADKGRRLRESAHGKAQAGDWDAALNDIGESTVTFKGILKLAGFPLQ